MTSPKKYDFPDEDLTCLDCDVKFCNLKAKEYHENSKSKRRNRVIVCCEYCEFRSCTKLGLTRHARQVHIEKFKWNCSGCGMKFGEEGQLKYHSYKCKGSKKSNKTDEIDSFWRHDLGRNACKTDDSDSNASDKSEKDSQGQFIDNKDMVNCFRCDATFTRLEFKRKHEAKCSKLHQCQFCPKMFGTKKTLAAHLRTSHLDEFKYNCSDCNEKFFKF